MKRYEPVKVTDNWTGMVESENGPYVLHADAERCLSDGIPKWIPVSEREPEASGVYIAYHGTARWARSVHFYRPRPGYTGPANKTSWSINLGDYPLLGVTHWMPLPEAPK